MHPAFTWWLPLIHTALSLRLPVFFEVKSWTLSNRVRLCYLRRSILCSHLLNGASDLYSIFPRIRSSVSGRNYLYILDREYTRLIDCQHIDHYEEVHVSVDLYIHVQPQMHSLAIWLHHYDIHFSELQSVYRAFDEQEGEKREERGIKRRLFIIILIKHVIFTDIFWLIY